MFDILKSRNFEIVFTSHAEAILERDFPDALAEIESTLADVNIPVIEIIGSGGGEAKGTQRIRRSLASRHWVKVNFEIKKTINGVERESISHEVDHVRTFEENKLIALEIEWNNKDPFFDRDLENFKRLHAEGAISAGVIITRGASMQNNMRNLISRFTSENKIQSFADLERLNIEPTRRQKEAVNRRVQRERNPVSFAQAWGEHFVSDKFGAATTHWRKLMDRVDRGVGNPCPLLLIGLPENIISFEKDAVFEERPENMDEEDVLS